MQLRQSRTLQAEARQPLECIAAERSCASDATGCLAGIPADCLSTQSPDTFLAAQTLPRNLISGLGEKPVLLPPIAMTLPTLFAMQRRLLRYAELDRIESLLENTPPTGDAPVAFKTDVLLRITWAFCDADSQRRLAKSCRLCYLFDLDGAFAERDASPSALPGWSPAAACGTPTELRSPSEADFER